ncbi:MAG: hypothetical protein COV44_10635 [Deltaproteobacteria bacterium CG11_big_fil_rev_8_21_14_0_20_45_16]|uniref:Uncharacterized protein n=2 Tax=Katanobacteria TaxID=422282 RepID=A0A2M7X0J0_UNCKA|nr:MAG: hypothetical protein COX05_04915 [candidate division WWE3 bacterium CG22_combo_CG10-13_8_21_14_all_39_12]PIR21939.1 MAG: hypothetical protein COV44_10635 [Deltaproteobacteria bacterium CG11_big_fil_rev_8_21_14_0_20_45_16]PJA39324.1 MAG: hypothetical protein CO179_05480 [candidate division WWE3 bacterium CG_4_9_14_3_um_filter_39_7]
MQCLYCNRLINPKNSTCFGCGAQVVVVPEERLWVCIAELLQEAEGWKLPPVNVVIFVITWWYLMCMRTVGSITTLQMAPDSKEIHYQLTGGWYWLGRLAFYLLPLVFVLVCIVLTIQ